MNGGEGTNQYEKQAHHEVGISSIRYVSHSKTDKNHRCQPDQNTGQHILGGMTAQVHAGEPHHKKSKNEKKCSFFLLVIACQISPEGGGTLGMSAGKGIAGGAWDSGFNRMKVRVQNPGTVNPTEDF